MLRSNIKKLMLGKGIKLPHAFLTKRKFTNVMATKLLNNSVKNIKLEHVENLCYYLHATPNDLFEWIPDTAHPNQEGHPLQAIIGRNEDIDYIKLAHLLTKDQLRVISEQVRIMALGK